MVYENQPPPSHNYVYVVLNKNDDLVEIYYEQSDAEDLVNTLGEDHYWIETTIKG